MYRLKDALISPKLCYGAPPFLAIGESPMDSLYHKLRDSQGAIATPANVALSSFTYDDDAGLALEKLYDGLVG